MIVSLDEYLVPASAVHSGIGQRHVQCLMSFFVIFLAFAMRTNLSLAIVAMTTTTGTLTDSMLLTWSSSQQGVILGSFFWGYVLLLVAGGHVSRRVGPRYPLLYSMLVCSVATLLSPLVALHCSWVTFCGVRVLVGLAQGFFTVSVSAHIAKWAPDVEKSRMVAMVFMGSQCGTMVTMHVGGLLAGSRWGWPSIFYVTGSCGVLWAVVWLFLGYDSPHSHPYISVEEREYIVSSQIGTSTDSMTMLTPWRSLLTSAPVWALFAGHWGQNWGFNVLLTLLPTYMKHVLGFDIKSNGLVSSVPYLLTCLLTVVFSWADDFFKKRHILSLNVSRKLWNTVGHWGAAGALVGLAFVSSTGGALTLLYAAIALHAGMYCGIFLNHLDLAPNFAGVVFGVVDTPASFASLLAPTLSGYIVEDEADKRQWDIVFYLAAAMFFVSNLIFILYGSAEIQPWNEHLKKSKEVHSVTRT